MEIFCCSCKHYFQKRAQLQKREAEIKSELEIDWLAIKLNQIASELIELASHLLEIRLDGNWLDFFYLWNFLAVWIFLLKR